VSLGGLPESFAEKAAGDVGAQDVILDVEALLGGPREQDAGGKGVAAVGERVDAGFAAVRSDGWSKRAPEPRS